MTATVTTTRPAEPTIEEEAAWLQYGAALTNALEANRLLVEAEETARRAAAEAKRAHARWQAATRAQISARRETE